MSGFGKDCTATGLGGAAVPLPRHRVLVVDNEHDVVDAQALLLEALGQDVRRAYDGPTALQLAWRFRPTLVILDVQMPGMDGVEVARQLRAMAFMDEARIVAHSGLPWPELRELTLRSDFDDCLAKPAALAALVSLLQRALPTSELPAQSAPARAHSGWTHPESAAPPPTAAP